MFIICWSAKGGVGTTATAASLGVLLAHATGDAPVTIVDLAGDVPAALGSPEPAGPGLLQWLAAPTASAASLLRLAAPVKHGLQVVHLGDAAGAPSPVRSEAAAAERVAEACTLAAHRGHVVVDAGCGPPPLALTGAADRSLLVTTGCFLALRRASGISARPTGVVLVAEPGRALAGPDVEAAIGAPVLANVPWDPAIARCVDAGLLASRFPNSLARALRHLTVTEVAR